MSQRRRVVITGMGLVSPLGNDMATSWDGIVNGRSGLGPITTFDTEGYSTKIAGEIRGFDPTAFVSPKDVKKMDSFIHYGLACITFLPRNSTNSLWNVLFLKFI